MRTKLSSSEFYRKAPPEADFTNTALILALQAPRLRPLTSVPRGDPSPLALPYHFTAPQGAVAAPGPTHSEPTTKRRGGGGFSGEQRNPQRLDSITRPWQACKALTHHRHCMHTCAHTPTPALIHQWGLAHIKVRRGRLGWVIGVLWGDGEMLKTRARKKFVVFMVLRREGARGNGWERRGGGGRGG